MGIFKAIADSAGGVFADQWKEIITAAPFNEHVAVSPGVLQKNNNGHGTNLYGSTGIISNGSKVYIPENTAAFVFSQGGIENIVTQPGGYEYHDGQESVFDGNSAATAIFNQIKERVGFGGISPDQKRIAFVNLREIRNLKFGTRGPLLYNDLYYGIDLEIIAYGSLTIKVVDPIIFIKNFVPPNVSYYSFDDKEVKNQILSEFLQSFVSALNSLSTTYRISQLPSHASEISQQVSDDSYNAGTWKDRFGFSLMKVAIESIEFADESRQLVKQFSTNKIDVKAYEDVTQKTSSISAQQKIARGIQENGLGDAGGMLFGMDVARELGTEISQPSSKKSDEAPSIDEQIEAVKKLKDLFDAGILTQGEFDTKKKEVMGL